MQRLTAGFLFAGVLFTAGAAAQQGPRAEIDLQAAMRKESVDGNLKAAIEAYRKLAQGKDRAVAAKALVRMGQCYDMVGDAEARKAYERVVSDFADQHDAVAEARKHLGTKHAAAVGPAARVIPMGSFAEESAIGPSPDGRFLLQRKRSRLELREVGSGGIRILTKGDGHSPVFSSDGKSIAFVRDAGKETAIWTVGADGKDERLVWRVPEDWRIVHEVVGWFPDGKRLLVQVCNKKDPHRLLVISLSDGAATVLKEDEEFVSPQLSPDGKFVV